MSRPAALAAASASMQRASRRSPGSSPSQRATPAEAVWPRGVAARTRSSTSQDSPRPQSGSTRPSSAPSRRASVSTSRSCARHDAEDSLTRRSPSCSPRSMLKALRWSRSITARVSGASLRRARAISRGSPSSHARRVGRPVSGSESASAPTRERSSSRSIATAACEARTPSISATASGTASTEWRQMRMRTPAICSPRSTGSKSAERAPVASTSGAASAGWVRASATKYDCREVKARPPNSDSGRGWMVTGAMSTPTIAVETNSVPDGSSTKATGAEATSHAARQTAGRASRLAGRARGGGADGGAGVAAAGQRTGDAAERGEPAGVLAQGLRHPLEVARGALALELGGQHAGEHGEQLLVGLAEAAGGARERGEAADPRVVGELERHAEVRHGGEVRLLVEAGVDRVAGNVIAATWARVLGHLAAVGVAQRRRLVGVQAEALAAARVDDAVHVVPAVEMREEQRHVGQLVLEQVEHRTRRVGEGPVGGRRRGGGGRHRSGVHRAIVLENELPRVKAQTKVRSGAMRLATFLTPGA